MKTNLLSTAVTLACQTDLSLLLVIKGELVCAFPASELALAKLTAVEIGAQLISVSLVSLAAAELISPEPEVNYPPLGMVGTQALGTRGR